MHFHVYLDENLAQNLAQLCQETHKKRNAVVREALQLYLEQQKQACWPTDVLSFKGIKDMSAFESFRSDLSSDSDRSFLE